MTAVADTKHAVQVLHNLQMQVAQTGDQGLEEQVTAIITMLDSPVFQQLLKLQVSIGQLKEHIESTPPGKPIDDFDFSPDGDLVFFEPEEPQNAHAVEVETSPVPSPTRHPYAFENKTFSRDDEAVGRTEPEISAQVVQAEESAPPMPPAPDTVEGDVDDFQQALRELALGREVHSIKLAKPEGSGLGFSVVGLKSENHGELGIFVQQIQTGGVVDRDGRLQESDQILAIDRELLTSTVSHQMAIGMLQKVRGQVELIIARGGFTVPSSPTSPSATAVPPQLPPQEYELEEDEMYVETIDLYNDGSGLGFGIVGVKDIGIVVKTILEGGTADKDGRLQSGDRILKIGDTSLEGMTSDQVAVVLRQSGNQVRLTIARGPLAFAPAAARTPIPEPSLRPESAQELQASQVPPELMVLDTSAWSGDDAQIFDVELTKGTQGIGITIAGYVTDQEGSTHSGIFVKSIAEGSAAHQHGNVKVNDQIIEVDGQSLQGFSNVEAVEVLRKTQTVVRLKLARYKAAEFDQEDAIVANEQEVEEEEPPPVAPADFPPPDGLLQLGPTPGETEDGNYEGNLSPDEEAVITSAWQSIMGYDVEIVVAQLAKFREGGGLGISLEGTVDIDENGQEVRPHHYIRSILPDGPVGHNGKLNSGDELLEVNGNRLLGLNHVEVVKTLKELPMHVRLVCARHPHPVFPEQVEEEQQPQEVGQESTPEVPQDQVPPVAVEGTISASTEGQLESAPPQTSPVNVDVTPQNTPVTKESLAGLAMWSDNPQVIELMKGDRGLGFSILDYQDPLNSSQTVIVIRSLVPGGVAEQDGRLIPGDRLVSVNDINLEDCSLDTAVGALKGAAPGIVRIGVAKPLPSDRSERDEQEPMPQDPEVGISADGPQVSMEVGGPTTPQKPVEEVVAPAVAMAAVEASPSVVEHGSEFKPPDLVTSASKPDEPASSELIAASSTPPQPKRKPPTPPPKPVLTPKNSNTSVGSPERTSSPSSSIGSPERFSRSSFGRRSVVILPASLEQVIILKKSNAGLGLTVHAEKGNGVVVKSIIRGGVVQQDGRLAVGDYITAVNNSSIRDHSNQEARSLIRRCSLDRADISISYIPASVAASYRENPTANLQMSADVPPMPTSPVPSLDERPLSDRSSPPEGQYAFALRPSQADAVKTAMVASSPPTSPERKLVAEDAEEVRTVKLFKEPGKSLGISIVGGRVHDGETMRGIYIKHVLPESPAGRSGSLKTGDRILEVNGCDLRVATHDQAVAIIRNSTNPVLFTVQSITPGSRPPSPLVEDDTDGAVLAVAVTVVDPDFDGEPLVFNAEVVSGLQEGEPELSSTDSESEDEFGYTWKKLSKKYESYDGELHLIELTKGDKGLGLSLAGNRDRSKMSVFIVGVDANGAAGQDGHIQIADEILEINGNSVLGRSHQNASAIIKSISGNKINGNSVVGRSHQNASAIIKSISGNKVALVIHRHPDSLNQLAVKPITPPPAPLLEKDTTATSVGEIQAQAQAIIAELEPSSASSPESTRKPKLASIGRVLPQSSVDDFSKYPNVINITLMKGTRGLGFAILESPDIFSRAGIFVKDITHDGPADQDGRLRIGDQILSVNDRSLVDVSKTNAIHILKDTDGAVRLTVSSDHPNIEEPEQESQVQAIEAVVSEAAPVNFQTTDLDKDSSDDEEPLDQQRQVVQQAPATQPRIDSLPSDQANSDPYTCPIEPGKETTIVIDKGKTGLGLSIVGGTDTQLGAIVVHEVYDKGAAFRDNRLQTGDQILSVNNVDLTTASHDEAITVLRQTPAQVKLTVFRDVDNYEVHGVELTRVPGKGLGLSIVGKRNDVGVFISDIVKGGVAEADGRLARGDQILVVNGEDVRDARQEKVASLLKASQGKIFLEVGRLKPGLAPTEDEANQSTVEHHATPAKVAASSPVQPQHTVMSHVPQDQTQDQSDNEPKLLDGIRIVNLHRSPGESLGFSIAGGCGSKLGDAPICVASISPGGMADKSRQLREGDCILTINGQSVEGATHTAAAEMLKKSQGKIVLEVYREEAMDQLMRGPQGGVGGMVTASPPTNSPTLEEPPGSPPGSLKTVELDRGPDGLGFSIVGGYGSPHGDLPIYIKTVFNRGAAAENGQLKRGDQIVAVNGERLDGVTHEEAVNILKRARGKVVLTVVA